MRAQKDRRAAAVAAGLDAAVQVAHVRPDRRAGVVLVDAQPEVTEVARDRVGNGTLLAGRAAQGRQLGEEVDDLRWHGASLETTTPKLRRRLRDRAHAPTPRRRTRGTAAPAASAAI